MKLMLHILKKDLRHFYPEILVNLALLIAFAIVAPRSWQRGYAADPEIINLVAGLLRVLLPLSWLVLISRAVHDEVLVGDRQFWITRPYSWQVLLAEKVCFLLLCVHLPFFLMQSYLLHHAGFAVLPVLGRLLHYQAYLAAVYVLPCVAIAVVTASFGQQVLCTLGGLLYLLLVGASTGWILREQMSPPYADWIGFGLVVTALLVVVLAMYAVRPVRSSRVALLCLPLVLLLVIVGLPTRFLVQRAYASTRSGDLLQFLPDANHAPLGTGGIVHWDKDISLSLPVEFHAATQGTEVMLQGARFSVHSADGDSWQSSYQGAGTRLQPGDAGSLSLRMPADVFERMAAHPAQVWLETAAQRFRFADPENTTVPEQGRFREGDGLCAPNALNTLLQCRYPLEDPPAALVQLEVQGGDCASSAPKQLLHTRTGGSPGLPLDFDPVALTSIPLRLTATDEEGASTSTPVSLCPGAHVSFAREVSLDRERLQTTLPALALRTYVVRERTGVPR